MHFGTTIGAWLKQKIPLNFTPDLYIGAGVAASISSGFGAPLVGLIFAHEAIQDTILISHIGDRNGFRDILRLSTAIWGDTNLIKVSSDDFNLLLILMISFLQVRYLD